MDSDDSMPTICGSWDPTLPMPLEPEPTHTDVAQRLQLAFAASRCPTVPNPELGTVNRQPPALKLVCWGLKPVERRLLEGTVLLSQRRTPRLELLADECCADADVIIVDAQDAASVAWSHTQQGLAAKPVIWIDAHAVPAGHMLIRRPVQWPVLPMMLARALEQHRACAAPAEGAPPQTAGAEAAPVQTPAAAARGLAPLVSTGQACALVDDDDDLAVRGLLRSHL